MQPPLHAPNWVFNYYNTFNPPADIAPPLPDEDWLNQGLCKDQQAARLLPPKPLGGPILHGACTCAECAYQDWKWAVNALWEDKRHCLQTAAHQCHLNKHAACKKQDAAHRQRLLDEHAANKCQEAARKEAARRQRLLDKEAACCLMAKRAALAQQMAAA